MPVLSPAVGYCRLRNEGPLCTESRAVKGSLIETLNGSFNCILYSPSLSDTKQCVTRRVNQILCIIWMNCVSPQSDPGSCLGVKCPVTMNRAASGNPFTRLGCTCTGCIWGSCVASRYKLATVGKKTPPKHYLRKGSLQTACSRKGTGPIFCRLLSVCDTFT